MKGRITLHPTLGVNPRLTICTQCGGPGEYLVLLGASNFVKTYNCGITAYGGIDLNLPCPKCGKAGRDHSVQSRRELDEYEKLTFGICNKCEALNKQCNKLVEEGGIYFKCTACGSQGAIRAETDMARHVREQLKIKSPEPCGIEFDKCEQHTVAPEETDA